MLMEPRDVLRTRLAHRFDVLDDPLLRSESGNGGELG
jgi:hypothetical protein